MDWYQIGLLKNAVAPVVHFLSWSVTCSHPKIVLTNFVATMIYFSQGKLPKRGDG